MCSDQCSKLGTESGCRLCGELKISCLGSEIANNMLVSIKCNFGITDFLNNLCWVNRMREIKIKSPGLLQALVQIYLKAQYAK